MISRNVLVFDFVYDFVDRKACYEKIRDSVVAAVANGKKKQKPAHVSSSTRTASGEVSLDQQFKDAILKHHSSVEIAWNAFDSISEPRGERNTFKVGTAGPIKGQPPLRDKNSTQFMNGHVTHFKMSGLLT